MQRVDTGKQGAEGGKIFAIKRISWTARTKAAEIEPGMFGQWAVRWVNPLEPQQLCFPIAQYYRNKNGKRLKPEIVNWNGASESEHPASCVDVAAAAPPTP